MTIFNLGSINIDRVYRVPHLPGPGETLAATAVQSGLGGKGANMSVAGARAGAHVVHIGAAGADGRWAVQRLMEYGVDTRAIAELAEETGHAIIAVDEGGENQILIWPGANHAITPQRIEAVLADARAGDIFVTQNETNGQAEGCRIARQSGMRVVYAAAPFDAAAVSEVIEHVDLLVLNAVEAEQLSDALKQDIRALHVADVIVTQGADGCMHFDNRAGSETHYPAFAVTPVDTTGAGDTFTGYLAAGLDRGQPMAQAIRTAQKAGALMVTRVGTADVIPDLRDVQDAAF